MTKKSQAVTQNRTQETMSKNFITKPGDVFIIKSISDVICDTLTINIINPRTEEDFLITFKNIFKSWDLLKKINETSGRSVMYQIDNNVPVNYEDSIPYKARFKK